MLTQRDAGVITSLPDIPLGENGLTLISGDFLGFPVGGLVPSGYYDREQAAWVPSENGRVVQVLGVSGGLAVYLLYNGVLKDTAPDTGNVLTRALLDAARKAGVGGELIEDRHRPPLPPATATWTPR